MGFQIFFWFQKSSYQVINRKDGAWGAFLIYGDDGSILNLVGKLKKKTSPDIEGFLDLLLASKVILLSHK